MENWSVIERFILERLDRRRCESAAERLCRRLRTLKRAPEQSGQQVESYHLEKARTGVQL